MAIKTFTTGEVLTAADTNTYLNNGGLVYIASTTQTAQTIIAIDSVFTATYDNYFCTFNCTGTSATGTLNWRLRTGGTPLATNYRWGSTAYYYDAGTAFGYSTATGVGVPLGIGSSTSYPSGVAWVMNPQLARKTTFIADGTSDFSNYIGFSIRGHANNTTSYDGIQVYQDAGGTITGTLRVYGVRMP